MLLKIKEARYLGSHVFELRFNDGRTGTVDARSLAETGPGAAFEPLRSEELVRRFEMKYGTLSWPGGVDVAPEFLYFLAFRDDPDLQEKFVEWGYLPQAART